MSQPPNIDGVLIQWGDRLFYPGNRIVRTQPQPRLSALAARQRAAQAGASSSTTGPAGHPLPTTPMAAPAR